MAEIVKKAGDVLYETGNFVLGIQLQIVGSILGGKKEPTVTTRELKDRTATIIDSEAPHKYVYGRARVGAAIVAALSSGTKDEYKHLVCVHAAHECDAIEEIYINGKALGTLDANGYVTSGDYVKSINLTDQQDVTPVTASYTLSHTPYAGIRVFYFVGIHRVELLAGDYTLTGTSFTASFAKIYYINYQYNTSIPYVRVLKHLGTAGQVADAVTISEVPTKWDATKLLSGMCYTIIRLDLNFRDFQSGVPKIEVLLRGKKLHDVRDGAYPNDTPIWSQNNTLMIADYLTSEMCGVPWTDLPLAEFITAANVCDEKKLTGCTYSQTLTTVTVTKVSHGRALNSWATVNIESGNGISGCYLITSVLADSFTYTSTISKTTSGNCHIAGLYTANGVVSADDSQHEILNKMAASMAGTLVATTWGIQAGKYTAPVMALNQSDIVGTFSYVTGISESDLYNGVRGKYISSANLYVPTDFKPYSNLTYVTSDGTELWTDIDYLFTDEKQRVHNLARIFLEDQRNSFTINADFSYKTFALQIGQRISFTSTLIGQSSKIYRVTQKNYAPDSSIQLTLKEDAATIWDLSDAVLVDETPNTNLPNPFVVGVPGSISITEELYETTGSSGVKVKAIVTWLPSSDANVQDYEIVYKGYSDYAYNKSIFAIGEYVELLDMSDGQYDIKIRARNHLNIYSEFTPVKTFTLYGLTAVPGNVLNFTIKPFNGSAICSWDKTVDLDVKIGGDVEIRYCPLTTGQSWEQSYVIPDGAHNGDATTAIVSLATGTYYAKFIDSTGRYSATEASFLVTEALITGWTTVTTSTQDPTFTGAKTNIAYDNNAIKLGGTTLWDALGLMDTWDEMDTLGGLSPTGTYLFDAVVNLGSIITRRFHLTMKALSVSISDTIDMRLDAIDLWTSMDGGVINGTNATVYASISDDNITYSNWMPFMVADFKCQYAKFKVILTSNNSNQNIEISQLRVAIKTPV